MESVDAPLFTSQFPSIALGLKTHELEALLSVLEMEELGAGETLIVQETESDALYLVWQGELAIVVETPAGEKNVARVGRGCMLGEVSLMDPGPASATVRTEKGCRVLMLPRSSLEMLWKSHPRVAIKFLRQLAREVAARIRTSTIHLNRILAGQLAQHNELLTVQSTLVGGGN